MTAAKADGRSSPFAWLARLLGCTEGQAYTVTIGLAVATLLAVAGVPAALQDKTSAAVTRRTAAGSTGDASAPVEPAPAEGAAPAAGGSADLGSGSGVAISGRPPAATVSPARPAPAAASPFAEGSNLSGSTDSGTGSGGGEALVPVGTFSTFARIGSPGAPGGVAVAPDGTVHVTTDNGTGRGGAGPSHLFSFDRSGALQRDTTVAGQPAEHADGLTGATVSADGKVVVLDAAASRVLSIDPANGGQSVLALVPDIPPCLVFVAARPCEPGLQDRRPAPAAVVADKAGTLYITDPSQATIWRLRSGQRVLEAWHQSEEYGTGDGPRGLALGLSNELFFTAGTTLDVSSPGGGALYRLAIGRDGGAGARTLIAAFARGEQPGALTVGTSGTAYVVLRGPGAVVAVDPKGAETARYAPPGGGDVPLDGPSGLALGDGRLFVTNRSTGNVAARWAVLTIAVRDTAVRV